MNLWIGHSKAAGWLCTIVGRISGCFLWQIVLDVLEHLPWILKFCSRADTDKNNPEQQFFFRRQHQQTHGSYRYKQTAAGQLHFSSLSHSLVLFHARWHVPGRLAGRGADLQQETAVVAALLNASKPCLDMIWCSMFLIASHYKISSVLEVHRAHRALSHGLSQYPRDIQMPGTDSAAPFLLVRSPWSFGPGRFRLWIFWSWNDKVNYKVNYKYLEVSGSI